MRAVVQRVKRAAVWVDGQKKAEIAKGLLVFLGVGQGDTIQDARYMVNKVVGLRIFEDSEGKMNLSISDIGGELLIVSQFTLYGDVRRGKRPSFTQAMAPDQARPFFDQVIELFRKQWPNVQSGVFGAMMDIELINDGPVTILLDSTKLF